jgi:hypothetical protein
MRYPASSVPGKNVPDCVREERLYLCMPALPAKRTYSDTTLSRRAITALTSSMVR